MIPIPRSTPRRYRGRVGTNRHNLSLCRGPHPGSVARRGPVFAPQPPRDGAVLRSQHGCQKRGRPRFFKPGPQAGLGMYRTGVLVPGHVNSSTKSGTVVLRYSVRCHDDHPGKNHLRRTVRIRRHRGAVLLRRLSLHAPHHNERGPLARPAVGHRTELRLHRVGVR
jgi:hypothetical protein